MVRRASKSMLMSRSSKAISLASRKIRINSQERHPGWVKSKTFATLRAWVQIRLYPVVNNQMSLETGPANFLRHPWLAPVTAKSSARLSVHKLYLIFDLSRLLQHGRDRAII